SGRDRRTDRVPVAFRRRAGQADRLGIHGFWLRLDRGRRWPAVPPRSGGDDLFRQDGRRQRFARRRQRRRLSGGLLGSELREVEWPERRRLDAGVDHDLVGGRRGATVRRLQRELATRQGRIDRRDPVRHRELGGGGRRGQPLLDRRRTRADLG